MPGKNLGVRVRIDRALRTMEGQHRRLREIHAELDRSLHRDDAKEIEAWIDRLRAALQAHFEIEESVVFPALAELAPSAVERVGRLAREHGSILAKLDVLLGTPAASRGDGFRTLRKTLASHESDEENVVRHALEATPASRAVSSRPHWRRQ